MHVIYKYPIPRKEMHPGRPVYFAMPRGAEILSLGTQDGAPVFWAKVHEPETLADTPEALDAGARTVRRGIMVRFTGDWYVEHGAERFIGTWQEAATGLVWHFFDAGEQ